MSELKAVFINEATGELEFLGDFVDTSHEVELSSEVEIVSIEEANSKTTTTTTTQSITKPLTSQSITQYHQQGGSQQSNIRSAPSLLRKRNLGQQYHHHQQQQQQQNIASGSNNNTINVTSHSNNRSSSSSNTSGQNAVVEFIPIQSVLGDTSSQSTSSSSTSFNFHHHGPSNLPPASAQFIRAVEELKCETTGSGEGTQLLVYNSVDNNFDVIPPDNIQLRLCQVVDEDDDHHQQQQQHQQGFRIEEGDDSSGEEILGHQINTIYICEEQPNFIQDSEYPNIQIVEELPMPMLQDAEGNVYELEDYHTGEYTFVDGFSSSNGTIFSTTGGGGGSSSSSSGIGYPLNIKRRKKSSSSTSTKEKPNKDGIATGKISKRPVNELKCLETGCDFSGVNVAELRKHLSSVHGMHFDEETIHFPSEKDFKGWRELYERERMVSFIFRGGTKKISRDQAVTYLICHRSGHYKPTMKDQSLRKRKMKPQGSCKMNGYCTAGIKLLKNLDTGEVRCEICHTHYGHPLNNDAIPHLRVNNTLRKIIWTKFQQGLTFNQVVQYLHHNPDRLDGLRLLDRRAVRNIYDKFKKNPNKSFLDEDYDNDDTLSPSAYITDGNNIMNNSNGTLESPFSIHKSNEMDCLEEDDEKPATGSVVEVHFEFPPETITPHLDNDNNTIIIEDESTVNNDDGDEDDSSSSLDDPNHQNNIDNNNINCTSTTTTTIIDGNNTDDNNMNIPTFTVYGSSQSNQNDQMTTILESHNSNTNNNNNNCDVNLTTTEQDPEELLLRNVEEEENEPLVPIEIDPEESILPDHKPIIIVNIPKKRGRPKKVQNSPNKLETDDSEQQHQSEFQDSSIFLSPQSSTTTINTTTTTPNTRTRTESHSQGSTSPIRRSTRERKRKTFYDEGDEENSSSSSSSVSHSPSTSSPSLVIQKLEKSSVDIKTEPIENNNTGSSTNTDDVKKAPQKQQQQQPKVKLSSSTTKQSTKITIIKQKNNKISKHDGDDDEEEDKLNPPTLIKFDNMINSKNSKVSSLLLPLSNNSQVGQQLDDSQPPILEKIDNISQIKKPIGNMIVDGNKRQKSNEHHTKEKDTNKNILQDSSSSISLTTTLSPLPPNELPPNLSSDLEVDEVVSNITANVKAVKKGNVVKRMNIKGKMTTSTVTTTTLPSSTTSSSSSSITSITTRGTQNKNNSNNNANKAFSTGNVKPTRASSNNTNTVGNIIHIPIQDCISEEVKTAIKNLLDHGEADPTVLMYKKFGVTIPVYGPQYNEFHKEDFCLIIQTPPQRTLMQTFGDIIHLDGHKGRQKDLKLMFIMVLDEYREAIPVAWLISNVNDDRMVKIFLRVLRQHVGPIQTSYFMAPIHSNYAQIWSSIFTSTSSLENGQESTTTTTTQHQPQMILNEEDTKRDMRIEVADAFSDANTRKVLNTLMSDMIYAVDQESLDCIYNNMEEYLITQHGQEKTNEFMEHFSQNWLTKTKEWTLIHRIGAPVNTLYASESFGKLKKFIAFKGTKILSSVIDPVLKIGYDKCFSRSKRMSKGDQKLMKVMEEIELYHTQSTQIPSNCFHPKNKGYTPRVLTDLISNGDPLQQRLQKQERSESNGDNDDDDDEQVIGGGVRNNIWGVYDSEKSIEYTVVDLQSPCRCKYICSKCNVCIHNYICSCPVSQIEHLFCKHIHFVHSQIQTRDSKIKWIQASTTANASNFHLVDNDTDIETIVFVSQHSLR